MGHNLDALFNPENIAVIGASNNPLKAGYTVIYNLNQIGYPKKVFPVTMSADEILGRKCYKKLSQIEDTVELVVLDVYKRQMLKRSQILPTAKARSYWSTHTSAWEQSRWT